MNQSDGNSGAELHASNSAVSSSSSALNHSIIATSSNGQYNNNCNLNGNKGNNEQKFRICRDFVRGACRRLFCKVSTIFLAINFNYNLNFFSLDNSIHMFSHRIKLSFVMIFRITYVHASIASKFFGSY